MWIKTKDNIIIMNKADDVKINNAFVVETDSYYFAVGLKDLPKRQYLHQHDHPISLLRNYLNSLSVKYKIYFIIDGTLITDEKGICNLCSHKFKGFTGTCGFLKTENTDEICNPDIDLDKVVLMTTGIQMPQKHVNRQYSPFSKSGFYLAETDFSLQSAIRAEALFQYKQSRYDRYYHRSASNVKLNDLIDVDKIITVLLNNGATHTKDGLELWRIAFPLNNTNIILSNGKELKEVKYDSVRCISNTSYNHLDKITLANEYLTFMKYVKHNGKSYKFARVGNLMGLSYHDEYYFGKSLLTANIKINDSVVNFLFKDSQHIEDIANLTNHEEPDKL